MDPRIPASAAPSTASSGPRSTSGAGRYEQRVSASRRPRLIRVLLLLGVIGMSHGSESPRWQQVWSEDFERGEQPDPEIWHAELGFVRNREEQYYTDRPRNLRIEDGVLIIEAHRERIANERHDPDAEDWKRARTHGEYSSASIHTRGWPECDPECPRPTEAEREAQRKRAVERGAER